MISLPVGGKPNEQSRWYTLRKAWVRLLASRLSGILENGCKSTAYFWYMQIFLKKSLQNVCFSVFLMKNLCKTTLNRRYFFYIYHNESGNWFCIPICQKGDLGLAFFIGNRLVAHKIVIKKETTRSDSLFLVSFADGVLIPPLLPAQYMPFLHGGYRVVRSLWISQPWLHRPLCGKVP